MKQYTLTNAQVSVLIVALTQLYDEIARTSKTSPMKQRVMELCAVIQNGGVEVK